MYTLAEEGHNTIGLVVTSLYHTILHREAIKCINTHLTSTVKKKESDFPKPDTQTTSKKIAEGGVCTH